MELYELEVDEVAPLPRLEDFDETELEKMDQDERQTSPNAEAPAGPGVGDHGSLLLQHAKEHDGTGEMSLMDVEDAFESRPSFRTRGKTRQDGNATRNDDVGLSDLFSSPAGANNRGPNSNASSPLSDVPDLPSNLLFSPTLLPSFSPPGPRARGSRLPRAAPAESSAAAAKRAAETAAALAIPAHVPLPPKRRKGGPKIQPRSLPVKVEPDQIRRRGPSIFSDGASDLSEAPEDIEEELREVGQKKAKKRPRASKKANNGEGSSSPRSKPKREGPGPHRRAPLTAKLSKMLKGKTQEVQSGPCLNDRYKKWGKCARCTLKTRGDTCRFRDYRVFPIDPETSEILGPGWFESSSLSEPFTPLPQTFNTPILPSHIAQTKRTVAPVLLPLITKELRHIVSTSAITREVDAAKHRSVCDFCSSTIFGGYFFCKWCGRDYCLSCERYISESLETISQSPWYIPDAARPRVHKCGAARMPEFVKEGNETMNQAAEEIGVAAGKDESNAVPSNLELPNGGHQAALYRPSLNVHDEPDGDGHLVVDSEPPSHGPQTKEVIAVTENGVGAEQTPGAPPEAPEIPYRVFPFHFRGDLHAVSRLSEAELREAWVPLAALAIDDASSTSDYLRLMGLGATALDQDSLKELDDRVFAPHPAASAASTPLTTAQVDALYTNLTHATVPLPLDPAGLAEQNRPFMRLAVTDLSDEVFSQLWTKGEPLVIDNVGSRLTMAWNPTTFVDRFGHEKCVVVDCQWDTKAKSTVGEFFERFLDRSDRTGIFKIKDWPDTSDFAITHPDLYDDFHDALPVPGYIRRDGVLNLYAHFPPGFTRPDIGPKMYTAFAAREGVGGQGSTRLHMDVADAVNLMLYASERSDGSPGCAVWDLYAQGDADKLRAYLRAKFDLTHSFTDPIHSQHFYLDSEMRRELWDEYGVSSFRVYQYPGQAVFIPAGCAHQVCNLADCIKMALDFISPHNVVRCQQLTQDFRAENFVKAWKEDVLQLYNVLWFAWLNCQQTAARQAAEQEEMERANAARRKHLDELASGTHAAGSAKSRRGHVSAVRSKTAGKRAAPGLESLAEAAQASAPAETRTDGAPAIAAPSASDEAQPGPNGTDPVDSPNRSGDLSSLVDRLLAAALAAPAPPPPKEGLHFSSATGSKWAQKVEERFAHMVPRQGITGPVQEPESESHVRKEDRAQG